MRLSGQEIEQAGVFLLKYFLILVATMICSIPDPYGGSSIRCDVFSPYA